MFTPEDMERMPRELEKLYNDLEWRVMEDIIRRIKINGEVTRAADWQINRLFQLGESKAAIKAAIQDALKMSDKEMDKIYEEAIASGYVRDKKLYEAVGKKFIPYAENMVLQQMVRAIKKQTQEELKNLTQSLGFAKKVNGKIEFTELADFYQQTLDAAMLDITSGTFDYNTVLKRTIETLTNSGLRTVDYATGWSNRVEVAARRALMTGVTQITGKINEQNAEELETEYFEVSWHADARPTHQIWQGRVYSKEELKTKCGLGTVDGLAGANCRHTYYPFIPGISTRNYTDEELDALNAKENAQKEWNGKKYTSYEASQKQRKMETLMRTQRQKIKLLEEGGADEEDIINAKCRYRKTMSEYVDFCETMGIKQQRSRIYGDRFGNAGVGKSKESNKLGAGSGSGKAQGSAKKISEIDVSEADKVIEEYNKRIWDKEVEHSVIVDQNGNVYYSIGEAGKVDISNVDLEDAIVTHNHPKSNGIVSFGSDDFDFMMHNPRIRRLEAVNEKYVYTVRVLKDLSNISYSDYYRKAMLVALETCSFDEEFDIQHVVFEILDREGIVNYERKKFIRE